MTDGTHDNNALQLRAKLRTLRLAFLDSLIAICERKDSDGLPIPPTAAELNVIRGVLRDNGMSINAGDNEDEELRRARSAAVTPDLPDFDEDDLPE